MFKIQYKIKDSDNIYKTKMNLNIGVASGRI